MRVSRTERCKGYRMESSPLNRDQCVMLFRGPEEPIFHRAEQPRHHRKPKTGCPRDPTCATRVTTLPASVVEQGGGSSRGARLKCFCGVVLSRWPDADFVDVLIRY
jgi:hypothetical protein